MDSAAPTHFNFTRDVIDRWASETPQALALWCVDENGHNEQRITFQQLALEQRRAASFFSSLGIRRGDRVLMLLPRVPQWWIAMLGLLRLGAVPVPATPMLTEKDIRYRLGAAHIRAVITDEENLSKLASFTGIRIVIGADCPGWSSFEAGLRNAKPDLDFELTRSDEPGILYFTSGTSGPPKMALHTHASYGYAHRITGQHWLNLKPGDVHWVLADPGWAKAAWSALFGPWHMGACIFVDLTLGKFHPRSTLKTLSTYPINNFCAPPTAYRLITHEDVASYRFPHLRHCVAAGESLTVDVFRKWKDATGLTIHEGYGQTETVVLIGNFRSWGREVRPGSMGHPAPGYEVALVDEQLNPVGNDKEGQVAIRVKPHRPIGLFQEYWHAPEETAARFRGDWYLTGDVARRDADGYYWYIGRADDIINSASYRIGPYEVETALAEHPAVLEAAVVGAPDELRGEVVKAFIVLKVDHARSEALKRELQEHCKRITAPYKYPRQIEFISEMPKTISGKIRRAELRKLAYQK